VVNKTCVMKKSTRGNERKSETKIERRISVSVFPNEKNSNIISKNGIFESALID
jgi:hypothetical protein